MIRTKFIHPVLWLLAVICLFGLQTKGLADDNLPPKVTTFKSLLTQVSDKFHITIIAEDQPLKPDIPTVKAREIVDMSGQNRTASVAVKAIAEAFDYSIQKQNKNVFLLQKRFSAPSDLPCITLEEWNASVKDVVSVAEAFSPKFEGEIIDDPRTKIFAQSLSADQLSSLKTKEGLSVQSMSDEQRRFVHELCLSFYIEDPLQDLAYNLRQGECITNAKTHFGWFNRFKQRLFGYTGPLKWHVKNHVFVQEDYFRPLNHLSGFSFQPNGNFGVKSPVTPAKGTEQTPGITFTSDTSEVDESKLEEEDRDFVRVSETLGTIISKLNQLRSAGQKDVTANMILSVDQGLAEKRLTLVGTQYTSPFTVFQSIADIYGVRIHTKPEQNERVLVRFRPQPATNLMGLRSFIRRAMPDPFLRFAQFKSFTQEKGVWMRPKMASRNTLTQWRVAATKRLRSTLETRLEEGKKEQLAFPELLDSERIALANLQMSFHADSFLYFLGDDEIQACIGQPETVVMTGGLLIDESGKKIFSMLINTKLPDGSLQQWACYQCVAIKQLGFSP